MMDIEEDFQACPISFLTIKQDWEQKQVSVKSHPKKLNKPVIKTFKRRAAESAEMGSLSSENRGVKNLLYVIDIFTKYAWAKPLKNKKDKTVHHSFIEIVDKFDNKPTKLWVDQGKGFL